jgi:murein DD-endopeptidase MepM/ murein hydrolase activator NlpD
MPHRRPNLTMMKLVLSFLVFLAPCVAHGQLPDRTIRGLKSGRLPDDTSYVYWLPFGEGRSYLFIQGANSKFSHKGELSYDFKMSEGSPVCAAREGVVVGLRGDSDKGGLKEENLSDGNFVMIAHSDGSRADYWHLKHNGVLVALGDTVAKGQTIGLSGNTGYTAFPHLHFQVVQGGGQEILVRFATKHTAAYLRPGKWYKGIRR